MLGGIGKKLPTPRGFEFRAGSKNPSHSSSPVEVTPMDQSSFTLPTDQLNVAKKLLNLENQAKNGSNWFFWIAGLSILNSILFYAGGGLTFVMGLGMTQIVDGLVFGLTQDMSGGIDIFFKAMGILINLLIAGLFIAFGVFAKKRIQWVLLTGMIIYAFDTVLVGIFGDWLGLLFHGLALLGLWSGWQAIKKLRGFQTAVDIGDPATMQSILGNSTPLQSEDQEKKRKRFRSFVMMLVILMGLLVTYLAVWLVLNGGFGS